jgi:hypothetical protein
VPGALLHSDRETVARPVDRVWLVGLLRAAGAVPGGKRDPDAAALAAALEEGRKAGAAVAETDVGRWRRRAEAAEATIEEFQKAAGVPMGTWSWVGPHDLPDPHAGKRVGGALRAVLRSADTVAEAHRRLADTAAELHRRADAMVAGIKE